MVYAILVLVGFMAILAMAYGALSVFAGSMSDAPYEGERAATEGAWTFGGGIVLLLAVIGVAIWRGIAG